jgi:F0F1-type ATP synthase epsilon subunit
MENKKSFELKIVSPKNQIVAIVEFIDFQTPVGGFFIGPNHIDFVSILKERSKFYYKKTGSLQTETIDIYTGFLKIHDGNALVIVDYL